MFCVSLIVIDRSAMGELDRLLIMADVIANRAMGVTIVGDAHPVFRTLCTIIRRFVHTAIASAAVWYRIPIAALRRICTPFGAIEAHARCALVLELIWQAAVGIVRDRKASV